MDEPLPPSGALDLLAGAFRDRKSGLLSLGPEGSRLLVFLRDGQVQGVGPVTVPSAAPAARQPRPDDSARLRLDRVLAEVGIRSGTREPAPTATAPPPPDLRERLLASLGGDSRPATFEEAAPAPPGVADVVASTEPLILEAVRRLRDGDAVRAALGDLDQRLVATAALAEERTLTLTEGYLLSRIDGLTTIRDVLRLVPLDPEETERSLLGLLLTGRVERRTPAAREERAAHSRATEAGPGPTADTADEAQAPAWPTVVGDTEAARDAEPLAQPAPAAEAPAAPALDPEKMEQRREILGVFQSLPLRNHFEVLGVEPGCSDADVKRAYVALAKRYHPDVHRDRGLEDLHDVLEAIFIRVGEAWEVLADSRSRTSYEARLGVVRRFTVPPSAAGASPPPPGASPPGAPSAAATGSPPGPGPSAPEYVPPEETLLKAQLLLARQKYWEAIQVLEGAVPQMESRRQQNRGRILLARAYAKNPNWVRKAEEALQEVVREDPANVDAHYELGLIYKAGGLAARAQAMFRRVVELRPDHREAAAELAPGTGPAGGGLLKRLFGRGKAS
jgi:hypothetical protein